MTSVPWSQQLAGDLLAGPLPRRWAHSQGVGRKAESIARVLGADAELLICAAWLHDVGYAPSLVKTGLHSLDGARYLRDVEQADPRVCALVAYHSCAHIEARNRGLGEELDAEFEPPTGLLTDALTYCDMTTTPYGEPVGVETRLSEILSRYGPGAVVTESITEASPHIIGSARRIEALLVT
ncbi:HD domain-containing protein [Streptomyces cocklensis]|uniref:Deoxyguanosinetriphosphate triphosphohydrolase n=1 Tax=Actinacidiphila cocklensis TaxID=887465 RepID=A0A9W4E5A9_9ACTN|nr:HD domain-containing protein [Actinacidiphila cocklensis]MDD1058101.1 HD domain-containing protein [Actinacidiphila cocklensis]CAG6393137.1 Deoxyguanosinetriphosphate triphosphohydrolase [Actinacidiphila cocklensis]